LEDQATEWKEAWRDDCLKTVCGFANASGGVLEIGRRDDGEVMGVADVAVCASGDRPYIAVAVGGHPFPISYRGVYYLRSGSTTLELTGNALDEFMLRKQGRTWDEVPVPYVKASDFDGEAFKAFRKKAVESTRLARHDVDTSDEGPLDALRLNAGGYLKRAAILLFCQDPEKWVTGAFVKIGMFKSDAELLYQHEIHGPLMTMPDKVVDAAYLNYFKGFISYEGIQRIETHQVPPQAFREAITNAIVHKDYSAGVSIQIKVFPDRVIIYNDGRLPKDWSVRDLLATHRSEPHNPMIANAFFRAGVIESWGRGIEKMAGACWDAGSLGPVFEFRGGRESSVTFPSRAGADTGGKPAAVQRGTEKDAAKGAASHGGWRVVAVVGRGAARGTQGRLLALLSSDPRITAKEISAKLGLGERYVKKIIKALKDSGIVERVGPDKGGRWVVKWR
jgi:ATP-dependent DNA helicase RecG